MNNCFHDEVTKLYHKAVFIFNPIYLFEYSFPFLSKG